MLSAHKAGLRGKMICVYLSDGTAVSDPDGGNFFLFGMDARLALVVEELISL